MSTVRRLYFYILTLISVEVVIWGVIGLVRTIVSGGLLGASSLLATGLSLVLVGVPIFFLHWRVVQAEAHRDPDERASRLRAVFLYGVLFAVLLPVLFAVQVVINRFLVQIFGLPAFRAWFGGDQTAVDNLIAIVVNLVAFAYFWSVLRADWRADPPENFLAETRRLYRYLWVLIGLSLIVSGVFNLLNYLLDAPGRSDFQAFPNLAGGIALLLVGTPVWWFNWWSVQDSLRDSLERRSLLRLVVLYLISLVSVLGVLTTAGSVLNSLIGWGFGESRTFVMLIQSSSEDLSALVPLAVMWAYYGRMLNREVSAQPDQPRRAGLRRLYFYILALLGLFVTWAGLWNLVSALAQLAFSPAEYIASFRGALSNSLAALLVGIPLWLYTWRSMQSEALPATAVGDHARRSVIRRAYLYLVIFLLVIGGMSFTGVLFFTLFEALLSQAIPGDLAQTITRLLLWLLVDLIFLFYHWRALRRDSQMAQQSLGKLHADFPTLILVEENDPLAESLSQSLAHTAPRLPVAISKIELGVPDETMLGAKAVVMPASLALQPPEALHLWLKEYRGRRILIPLQAEGYYLLGQSEKSLLELSREAAQAVRQMAEGEALRRALPNSPWAIAGIILGSLFGLQILFGLFMVIISALFR
jgi:hypothetical protein